MKMEKQSSNNSSSVSASFSSWFRKLYSSASRVKSLKDYSRDDSQNSSEVGLIRRFGAFDLIVIGIGATIGSGIFVISGTVASDTGPCVILSFILAGAASVLNALCFAELASHFPAVAGGLYLYTYAAFNELTTFLVSSQNIIDRHVSAATIARSLASYLVTILEVIPFFKEKLPSWIGADGKAYFGSALSINLLAPVLVALLTIVLCRGVKESSALNLFMSLMKVGILLVVITIGAFKVNASNWLPFVPNGLKPIVTGGTVAYYAFLGFDIVAMSAEEAKRPQRNLPIGILGSLFICTVLYIAVCLVLTGMVSYKFLGVDAPLSKAFALKGLKYISVVVSIGATAGLTTTLLMNLYSQSRFYLCLGRDGLLPSLFSKVHSTCRTPIRSQVWVGLTTSILAGLFDVHALSHCFSVGSLIGYAAVCASLITLRWESKLASQVYMRKLSNWQEGVICLVTIASCGLGFGLCFRFNAPLVLLLVLVLIATLALCALYYRQVYVAPPAGFSCPGVPALPAAGIFFNMFLFAQLHPLAWIRFAIGGVISICFYAFYGQHHSKMACQEDDTIYHSIPIEEDQRL